MVITCPNHPLVLSHGSCCCDLRLTACSEDLPLSCMQQGNIRQEVGVGIRQWIETRGSRQDEIRFPGSGGGDPPGKTIQKATIHTWQGFLRTGQFTGMWPAAWRYDFISDDHPWCKALGLRSFRCFLRSGRPASETADVSVHEHVTRKVAEAG